VPVEAPNRPSALNCTLNEIEEVRRNQERLEGRTKRGNIALLTPDLAVDLYQSLNLSRRDRTSVHTRGQRGEALGHAIPRGLFTRRTGRENLSVIPSLTQSLGNVLCRHEVFLHPKRVHLTQRIGSRLVRQQPLVRQDLGSKEILHGRVPLGRKETA